MLRRSNGRFSMLIKWDTLLVAVAIAGGSVLIENSHRIDTGTPDDEVIASAPAACIDARLVATLASDPPPASPGDDGPDVGRDTASPPACE